MNVFLLFFRDCVHFYFVLCVQQSMVMPSDSNSWNYKAHKELRDYVNLNPLCSDFALPLWAIAITSHASEVSTKGNIPVGSIKSQGENKVGAFFPPASAPPAIWVDLPGIDVVGGVELSAYPTTETVMAAVASGASTSSSTSASARGRSALPLKEVPSAQMASTCVTDIVRILGISEKDVPVSNFKSTLASTHWIW